MSRKIKRERKIKACTTFTSMTERFSIAFEGDIWILKIDDNLFRILPLKTNNPYEKTFERLKDLMAILKLNNFSKKEHVELKNKFEDLFNDLEGRMVLQNHM